MKRLAARSAFRTAFFVLVCTGVTFSHISCQGAGEPEETGPRRILLEEAGLGLADLPRGCAQVEPSENLLELACELLETTENPAGPTGSIRLELGELTNAYIGLEDVSALDDIREEHRPLFEALPGGEFQGVGGQIFYGPLGASRYSRGRFQTEDGEALQRLWLFMVHPTRNELVSLVYDHPLGDNVDSAARLSHHLLVLLENLRTSDELQAEIEAAAATDDAAADDTATD